MSASAREWVLRIVVPVATIALLAIVAEAALQIAAPLLKPRFTRVDPELGWTHYGSVSHGMEREGHHYVVSYNSHGYRVPEHTYDKPDGVRRVVVLGDSFTDGAEVDDTETFTWLLDERLDADRIEVINLGVYSYTTVQELLTLEREALRYDPDLVVLLTMTNDFSANNLSIGSFGSAPRALLAGDGFEIQTVDHPDIRRRFRETNLWFPGVTPFHRYSRVYYLVNAKIYQRLISDRIRRLSDEQMNALPFDDQVELYRRLVTRMRDRSGAAGAAFAIVFGWQDAELREPPATRAVPDRMRELGFRTADLWDTLQGARASRALYWQEDIHWNPEGHAVVAEFLEPQIRAWLAPQWTEATAKSPAGS